MGGVGHLAILSAGCQLIFFLFLGHLKETLASAHVTMLFHRSTILNTPLLTSELINVILGESTNVKYAKQFHISAPSHAWQACPNYCSHSKKATVSDSSASHLSASCTCSYHFSPCLMHNLLQQSVSFTYIKYSLIPFLAFSLLCKCPV